MLQQSDVQIVNRFVLNGTIDGHDPIGVTFRIKGNDGFFRITFISVNWGRGYAPGEFHRNVMNVLNKVGEREYVVLLIQELDEADAAPERKIFMKEMEPGTTLVPKPPTAGRETIAISPGVKVRRRRKVMTMNSGLQLNPPGPPGTGPKRYFVSCYITVEGIVIAVGNQHPHRNMDNMGVQLARSRGEAVTRTQVEDMVEHSDMTVHGGDMNDLNYPKSHRKEKVAIEKGLDTIRYIVG